MLSCDKYAQPIELGENWLGAYVMVITQQQGPIRGEARYRWGMVRSGLEWAHHCGVDRTVAGGGLLRPPANFGAWHISPMRALCQEAGDSLHGQRHTVEVPTCDTGFLHEK